jgi:hypothetical protein
MKRRPAGEDQDWEGGEVGQGSITHSHTNSPIVATVRPETLVIVREVDVGDCRKRGDHQSPSYLNCMGQQPLVVCGTVKKELE